MEKKPKAWATQIGSYEEVKTLLAHPATQAVSPENSKIYEWIKPHAPRFAQALANVVLTQNGGEHRRLRQMYQRLLSPSNIRRITQNFDERVKSILAAIPDLSHFDWFDELSRPIVLGFVLDTIGLDQRLIKTVGPLVHLTAAGFDFLNPPDKWKQIEVAYGALEKIIEERASWANQNIEDPIYDFLNSDQWKSHQEKIDNLAFLLGAAYETTSFALAGSLVQLAKEPHYWAQLRDSTKAPQIVEDCLRLVSPVKTVVRIPKEDLVVGQERLPQGRLVQAVLVEANTNASDWKEHANSLHPEANLKHVAFGYGPHFCAGAPLARIELQTVLGYLSAHFRAPVVKNVLYSETAWIRSIVHAYGGFEAL